MKFSYTKKGELEVMCLKGLGLNTYGEWFVKYKGQLFRKTFPMLEPDNFIQEAQKSLREMSVEFDFPFPSK